MLDYGPLHPPLAHPSARPSARPFMPAISAYKTPAAQAYELLPDGNAADNAQLPRRSKKGVRTSLLWFAIGATIVLTVNISWLLWAKFRYALVPGAGLGFGVIFYGACSKANTIDTWLHLLINTLSTILLLASSCFMQAFSSPTRAEVDRAHARGHWMHIGTLSFRNFKHISKGKTLVCLLLALSSIPFHLLYNSLIFTSSAWYDYQWALVTEGFFKGETYVLPDYDSSLYRQDLDAMRTNAAGYERLDNGECLSAYANSLASSRGNVLLVTATTNATTSVLDYSAYYNFDGQWLCTYTLASYMSMCNATEQYPGGKGFQLNGIAIDHCLSQHIDPQCSVQFSWDIMIIVLTFNTLKILMMAYVLLRFPTQKLLSTTGDAMASFLSLEDPTTHHMCCTEYHSLEHFWAKPGFRYPRLSIGKGRRLLAAVSKRRLIYYTLLMLGSITCVVIALAFAVSYLNSENLPAFTFGFGKLNPYALAIDDTGPSMIVMALIANVPQLFISVIYLTHQTILVSMYLAKDWSKFAIQAQSLMVNSPVGKQRGTWMLGLPWLPGTLFITTQVLFHWLLSQSLFAVQIEYFDTTGHRSTAESGQKPRNLAYSPVAAVTAILAAFGLLISLYAIGFTKTKRGSPPTVATSSAAISASCHPAPGSFENGEIYEELRWGQVSTWPDGIGHCSFGSAKAWREGRMGPTVAGQPYA